MRRRITVGAVWTLGLAAVLYAGGATRRSPDAASASCESAAPVVLPEPAFTRGESNTIRWEHVPNSCWIGNDVAGNASTDRRFRVTITNLASGGTASVTVHGRNEVDATIDPDELPRGPNGQIDGVRFEYVVVRKEKWCSGISFGICAATSTRTSYPSLPVRSTQDTRRPSGSLELAGGVSFVRAFRVPARITATDPVGAGGSAGSGPGYVEFDASPQLAICQRVCIQSLDGPVTVQLESGPDGLRTVQARVYDRARRPDDDPGPTATGIPPGNVSLPFTDVVILDTTPPQLLIRVSTVQATVGVPVTLDASQTVDVGGANADSGVDPPSVAWSFGDGATGSGLVVTHAYSAPGSYAVSIAVSDRVGNVARADLGPITVVAAPVPPMPQTTSTPSTPTPKTADRKAPSLSALSLRRRGGRMILGLRASERATLVVEARRLSPRPQRTLGSFRRQVRAGKQELTLPTALARRLRASGRYRLVLAVRDAAGNVGRARIVGVTVR